MQRPLGALARHVNIQSMSIARRFMLLNGMGHVIYDAKSWLRVSKDVEGGAMHMVDYHIPPFTFGADAVRGMGPSGGLACTCDHSILVAMILRSPPQRLYHIPEPL